MWMVGFHDGWQLAENDAVVVEWIRRGMISATTPIRHSSWPSPRPIAQVPAFASMFGGGNMRVPVAGIPTTSMDPKLRALAWCVAILFGFGLIRTVAAASFVAGAVGIALGIAMVTVVLNAMRWVALPGFAARAAAGARGRPALTAGWIGALVLGSISGILLRSARMDECRAAISFLDSSSSIASLPADQAVATLGDLRAKAAEKRRTCTLAGMTAEATDLLTIEEDITTQHAYAIERARQEAEKRGAGLTPPNATLGAPSTKSAASTSGPSAAGANTPSQREPLIGPNGEVAESRWGEEWPLTVPSGRILCSPPSMVIFQERPGGPKYAVNGSAGSCVGNNPLCNGLRLNDLQPIWRDDKKLGHGLKVSVGDLITVGLAYCQKRERE